MQVKMKIVFQVESISENEQFFEISLSNIKKTVSGVSNADVIEDRFCKVKRSRLPGIF